MSRRSRPRSGAVKTASFHCILRHAIRHDRGYPPPPSAPRRLSTPVSRRRGPRLTLLYNVNATTYATSAHGAFLLPRPATAPPNLPSCFPKPVRALFASAGTELASFAGTGGALPGRPASLLLPSTPSPIFSSPIPNCGPSSASPPYLPALRARSWTLRNFSRSSDHRMMPSSLPFSLGGRSYDEPGVDLRCVSVRCFQAEPLPSSPRSERRWAVLNRHEAETKRTHTKLAVERVGSR